MFPTLYPSRGCAPMRGLFLISYRDEIEVSFSILKDRDGLLSVA